MANLKIDHLGIAVSSLADATAAWEALGFRVEATHEVPTEKVRVALLPVGESRLELLEPTDPSSTIARFLEKRSGLHHVCVLVDDLDAALAVADAWAPEHLEIQTEEASALAARVRNAGAVFVGPYAPVSLGDYLAGSNHVLPTGGTARHGSGLSVLSFLRGMHVVAYGAAALAEVAPHIDALGGAEDLAAHVNAVRVRAPGAW